MNNIKKSGTISYTITVDILVHIRYVQYSILTMLNNILGALKGAPLNPSHIIYFLHT